MRDVLFIALIALELVAVGRRLPAWQSDRAIWTDAVTADPDDPWALTNAAHYTHNQQSMFWYAQLLRVPVPAWLPIPERTPYAVGYESAMRTLEINGYQSQAAGVGEAIRRLRQPDLALYPIGWKTVTP